LHSYHFTERTENTELACNYERKIAAVGQALFLSSRVMRENCVLYALRFAVRIKLQEALIFKKRIAKGA
jgi:hypothetical protein